jgi:phosphoribosylglycinamide formyltransferase 2
MKRIMLLGSGELGKEFVISAKRLGCFVIACDSYDNAPAMQVADKRAVFNMLDADALRMEIAFWNPDIVVPEIEAIRTEVLKEFEDEGIQIVPSAYAVNATMNRDTIRDIAASLGIRTAKFAYAETAEELTHAAANIGYPVVVKPVMSSSGKGQSVVESFEDIVKAWNYAVENSRGDRIKVIVEEFINFHTEITLLTVKQKNHETIFCNPIGHVQERGDYQYSWQNNKTLGDTIYEHQLEKMKDIAQTITDHLGGAGIFGVEFFLTEDEVIFSELSPRPHDTGMVTLRSQNLSEFDLHARAILGYPIPYFEYYGGASAVILASEEGHVKEYKGIEEALDLKSVDVRIFGKYTTRKYRRMGVILASNLSTALEAQKLITVCT